MKNSCLVSLGGLLCILIVSAGCVAEQAPAERELTYYTEQYPPFNYLDNGTVRGIAVDLLIETTGHMGSAVSPDDIHLVPWTEGYLKALTGPDVVLFATVRLPEREMKFKWAGPIVTEKKVLFARADRGITIDKPEDLARYRIGIVTDDAAVGELENIGVDAVTLTGDPDPSVVADMLLEGKIDLFAYGKEAGDYYIRQKTGNSTATTVVYELGAADLYYAFSPDTPDTTVAAFQAALDEVKNASYPGIVTRASV
jgi:polar amino acid transport system substrate-binding protein